MIGKCKITNRKCDGNSLICNLNPEPNPVYREIGDSEDRPFYNRFCSNFKKKEKYR